MKLEKRAASKKKSYMQLIPLEKIHSSRDSVRKARESHLIDKAMTLEPHALNRRDELLYVIHILSIFPFQFLFVFMLYVISASPFYCDILHLYNSGAPRARGAEHHG